ncbi:MAG: hypothetical protein ABIT08_04280 [Bacteroidia bacterium]
MKNASLFLLIIGVTAWAGCQEDIPLLGEGNDTIPKTEVFINSFTLQSFPEHDPATSLIWDAGSVQPFDPSDTIGPDIYYYFHYKTDTGLVMQFKQFSHFSNVLPLNPDSPLVYILTEPFQIFPEYIDSTFYVKVYDLDYANPVISPNNDSTLIDSIPFTIGPDYSQPNPYITSLSGTGFNGSRLTLGLQWK